VPLLLLGPSLFSNSSFWVNHPVNREDQHLLAHAMASDFSVTWQFLSNRAIGLSLQIPYPTPYIFIQFSKQGYF
jgi:hypothetical protein